MTVMASNPTEFTDAERPFTVDDLEEMPDDGRRYELIDGVLLVSPAPGWPHQGVVTRLWSFLDRGRSPDLRVIVAPFSVRYDTTNEVQPDVLVARFEDLTAKSLTVPPLLAVEVISRSSRLIDRNFKLVTYARMGVPSYWLVDPDPENPSIEVFELLDDKRYEPTLKVAGEGEFSVENPFPVSFTMAELVADLHP